MHIVVAVDFLPLPRHLTLGDPVAPNVVQYSILQAAVLFAFFSHPSDREIGIFACLPSFAAESQNVRWKNFFIKFLLFYGNLFIGSLAMYLFWSIYL